MAGKLAANVRRVRRSGWLGLAATMVLGAQPGAYEAPVRNATVTLSGRATFNSAIAPAEPIDMSGEAYCQEAEGRRGVRSARQHVRLGAQNGLADVVVQIRGVPSQAAAPKIHGPVVLDQRGCMYAPAVIALRVGQTLIVRNSDEVLHNVHVKPKFNQAFNLGQPLSGMQSQRTFRLPEPDIHVRCDIHDWMQASIAVFDHAFFAVTAADGSFSIEGLPPGEYDLEMRHATLGLRTQRVRVSETGTNPVTVDFSKS